MSNYSDIDSARAVEQELAAAAAVFCATRTTSNATITTKPDHDAELAAFYAGASVDFAALHVPLKWPDLASFKGKPAINEPLIRFLPAASPAPLLLPQYHRWDDDTGGVDETTDGVVSTAS